MTAETLRQAANLMRETHRHDTTSEAETLVAVAAWLDWLAPFAGHGDQDAFVVKHGLAVARAYLGEVS